MRSLARRALHGVALLWGVSLLTFALLALAPGDFFDAMRLDPQIAPASVGALRARYGLERPLPVRYFDWLRSAARGEFGYSFAYNRPAGPLVWERARKTLLLTVTAMLLCWMIAVPVGVWCAARHNRWPDRAASAGMAALVVVPDLLLGLGLLLFAVRTRLVPVGSMMLPVAALVLSGLPSLVRHTRAAMVEVLDAPFVAAARAQGIPPARLLFRHALPAAANPLISLFGFSVGALLSGSLLMEVVLGWPGMGPLLLDAVLARDLFVVIDGVLFSTVFLIVGNLLADVLLYAADPRIRVR